MSDDDRQIVVMARCDGMRHLPLPDTKVVHCSQCAAKCWLCPETRKMVSGSAIYVCKTCAIPMIKESVKQGGIRVNPMSPGQMRRIKETVAYNKKFDEQRGN